jgi:hypothetical protein
MEMSVVPNFDINWNELEQIEMDDKLENTFLQLTALDVSLNIHIDEHTIVTVTEVHQPPVVQLNQLPHNLTLKLTMFPVPLNHILRKQALKLKQFYLAL